MLRSIKYKLAGKSASYMYNALEDAKLSLALVDSPSPDVYGGKHQSERLRRFVGKSKSSMIVYSFTLYHINGYLDYLYARLLGRIVGIKSVEKNDFQQNKFTSVWNWLRPLVGDMSKIIEFASSCGIDVSDDPIEILNAIKFVQEQNISQNQKTQKMVSKRPKFALDLADLDKKSKYADDYLESFLDTQKSAIFWDKVYIRLINLRLKKIDLTT